MKKALLLIIAIILFVLIAPFGFVYTGIYYCFKDKSKGFSYTERIAFAIDILGNCCFGELFDLMFSECRNVGYFGYPNTISSSIGYLIAAKNINSFGVWFSKLLDKCFNTKDHCLNAYRQEILNRK